MDSPGGQQTTLPPAAVVPSVTTKALDPVQMLRIW